MERHYRKFARRFYRFFRHPKRRKSSAIYGWIGARVFDRRLWAPARDPMIGGIACGLCFSMLPPLVISQMLVAALVCVWRRWNIPVAVIGCWLSNPVTWVPQVVMQVRLGRMVTGGEGVAPPFTDGQGISPELVSAWARSNALEYSIGVVLSMIIFALAGWMIGSTLWYLFGHYVKVPHKVPHRTERNHQAGGDDA